MGLRRSWLVVVVPGLIMLACPRLWVSAFVIRASFGFRISDLLTQASFVIRHWSWLCQPSFFRGGCGNRRGAGDSSGGLGRERGLSEGHFVLGVHAIARGINNCWGDKNNEVLFLSVLGLAAEKAADEGYVTQHGYFVLEANNILRNQAAEGDGLAVPDIDGGNDLANTETRQDRGHEHRARDRREGARRQHGGRVIVAGEFREGGGDGEVDVEAIREDVRDDVEDGSQLDLLGNGKDEGGADGVDVVDLGEGLLRGQRQQGQTGARRSANDERRM